MSQRFPAPWVLFPSIDAQIVPLESTIVERLSEIPTELAGELTSDGFWLWGGRRPPLELLRNAAHWIDRVPSISSVCSRVVDDLHLLQAEAGYDISHSEPRWRKKIFVSIPERDDSIGAVRLAESIIHEAMHLQLTDFEEVGPLVSDFVEKMRSPWKPEARSFQGVLHGLFVFACISEYFVEVLKIIGGDGLIADHCRRRVDEIAIEVGSIDVNELVGGLTAKGTWFARQWHNMGITRFVQ